MTVAIKFAYIVLICLINESMEITIRRGKNIVYQSKSEHLTSNVNSKHRDWVNEIKEEIKLSNLASPRKEGELDTPKGPPKKLLIFGSSETNGEICQRRIELVASKMYDEKVECRETVLTECVQGYTTKYEPTKVRQCTEDFKKNCQRYKRECDPSGKRGEEICVTVPSTVCISSVDSESSQEEIKCTQESKKICGPDTCALLKEEVCVTEVKDVIQDVPRETCRIEPTQTCRNVTKLVPNLHSKEDWNLKVDGEALENGQSVWVHVESRKCDTGIKCEEKDTTADSFLTETLEVTIPLSTGSDDSPTNDSPTDDSPTNDSPTDESPTGNSPNTDTDTSIVISGDDTLSLRGSTSNKTDDSDGLSSQVTIEPQDAFDCARNRIRFISSDHIKNIALPPNGEMRDKVRLCQILCVQKDGCQFYNIHVSAAQSSCTLFRAISDVVEEAEGYVGGIRHCLEEPVPVNDDEIIEDAS
ncbi:unnamed protein product [Lepeophtheirus salmonis]|uniref:(salmon louse) hypothetical protein n=1 Tax=Lepeophtheirus salmonis TaxID=72036 RepID=A0A7R8CCT8_LEPSM|nr:unnamed protein product [Lepeophtheirus salmonis]CAF2766899.1 unnamed protein product [Lepeophtheirus salmonis]